ncbi:hypothetical protein Dimus_005268, partial [Dionaea muscipula]
MRSCSQHLVCKEKLAVDLKPSRQVPACTAGFMNFHQASASCRGPRSPYAWLA